MHGRQKGERQAMPFQGVFASSMKTEIYPTELGLAKLDRDVQQMKKKKK
jgi:hypothetical protein